MSRLYIGEEWAHVRPPNSKSPDRSREIVRKPCQVCGVEIEKSALLNHAWSKKCVDKAEENDLEAQGWVPSVSNWNPVLRATGVELKKVTRLWVPGWASLVLRSKTAARFLRIPSDVLLSSALNTPGATDLIERMKTRADIDDSFYDVAEVVLISMLAGIENITITTKPLNYTAFRRFVRKFNQLADRFSPNELQVYIMVLERLDEYITVAGPALSDDWEGTNERFRERLLVPAQSWARRLSL